MAKDSHSEPETEQDTAQPGPRRRTARTAKPAKKAVPRKAAKKKTARPASSSTRRPKGGRAADVPTEAAPESKAGSFAPTNTASQALPPSNQGSALPPPAIPTPASEPDRPAAQNSADAVADSGPAPAAAGETSRTENETPPDAASPATPYRQDRPGRFRRRDRDRDRNPNRQPDRDRNEAGVRDRDAASADPERFPRKPQPLGPPSEARGYVELSPKGFGFLREADRTFLHTSRDTFIPPDFVRTYGLRDGMLLDCEVRRGVRGPQITAIHRINDRDPKTFRNLPLFEELTAINPTKRIVLETRPERFTTRVIDMMTPIGRGQRGLIVAPPRTGKTTLLQHIAEAVAENYPPIKVIVLLVDERPEEVTELSRALPKAEIFASSNDSEVRNHIRVAELAIERAKRLVEAGDDVLILLDSITRLARAFNNATRGKGRTGSGGLEIRALEGPRKLFAAARNTREAGSLTIVATALIQTNSRADEVIFQEFKGTGNMELVLDRQIAQQYVFPAVDIFKSGTRREELLLPPHQREKIYVIRRGLAGHKPIEAIERLITFLQRFPNNAQMLMEIKAAHAEV
ncbi:MAG TPA: transcription termination factor Rho [Verrucomicrobiales bacterium]|nr:transcription termination factor Rho [Verrucomicrobiales bacterium]